MINVAEFFKEEKEFLYVKGFEKGVLKSREKEQTKFVSNLMKKSDLSITKIVELADVSVEFVKEIKL